MKYSLIVPVYNVEKYLDECICSVLNQTHADFELILVDDGAKDSSPQICDKYAASDRRVAVIHKENGGPTSARKAGIAAATGDYIVCIDGDDFIKPDLLKKVNEVLQDGKYDICCFSFEKVRGKEHLAPVPFPYGQGCYDRARMEREIFPSLVTAENGKRFPPSIWGKVFKRELVTEIHLCLPDNIVMGEDSCISYPSVYRAKSLYILDESLYCYRELETSLTGQRKKALSWDEPQLRAELYLKYLPAAQFQGQIARITAHSLFNVSTSLFYAKKYRAAKREIKEQLKSEKYAPYLKQAKFKKNVKEKFALYCLKHRWIFPIWVYSKVLHG